MKDSSSNWCLAFDIVQYPMAFSYVLRGNLKSDILHEISDLCPKEMTE